MALIRHDRFILPGDPEPLWLRLGVELERARREARSEAEQTAIAASAMGLSPIPAKGEHHAERNAERAA
jgi:hypothetical protein